MKLLKNKYGYCIGCNIIPIGKTNYYYGSKMCPKCVRAYKYKELPKCLDCNKQLTNHPTKRCEECHFIATKGKNHPAYIDGRTPLALSIRNLNEYINWRISVFNRDSYTCQECSNVGDNLNAHHKKQFSTILSEFLKEYDQFSPLEDKWTLVRLATKYKQFWDINNGQTLCKDCHSKKLLK